MIHQECYKNHTRLLVSRDALKKNYPILIILGDWLKHRSPFLGLFRESLPETEADPVF